MSRYNSLVLLVVCLFGRGFIAGDAAVPPGTEIVMAPESRITATTNLGTIVVTSGKGLKRSYTWEGATRSVEMIPRRKRWYGSLGLYYPGPGEHWFPHKGISRAVLEEGQQHFASAEEALAWIKGRTWMPFVYTSTGLVVGWGKVLARKQLNVEIWQIYIARSKPVRLPGASDTAVRVAPVAEHG